MQLRYGPAAAAGYRSLQYLTTDACVFLCQRARGRKAREVGSAAASSPVAYRWEEYIWMVGRTRTCVVYGCGRGRTGTARAAGHGRRTCSRRRRRRSRHRRRSRETTPLDQGRGEKSAELDALVYYIYDGVEVKVGGGALCRRSVGPGSSSSVGPRGRGRVRMYRRAFMTDTRKKRSSAGPKL